jgi:ribosomal protein L37AE/L43A
MPRSTSSLSEMALKLKLLFAGVAEGRRRDEADVRAALREVDLLNVQCQLIDQERAAEREHYAVVVRQLQDELAQASHDKEEALRQLQVARTNAGIWHERYCWVDEERAMLQGELDGLRSQTPEMDRLPTIWDTAFCPFCGAEHLVGQADGSYQCLYCSEKYSLAFGRPLNRTSQTS